MQKDESQISRQARWQRKHRAMGLCVLCSRPAFKGWRCKKHYEQHKITMRLRYIPKVRGRYKVSGATETTTKRKAAKPAKAKTTRAAKPAAKRAKPAASRATTARKSVKATAKTTARKSTARKTTTRRAAPKRAAKG
jgi:hypothetical protein